MEYIKKFLASPAYSDDKLAALLAHAQDGKLAFYSCCCLRGFPTADHAYRGAMALNEVLSDTHYSTLRETAFEDLAHLAEVDFRYLGATEEERRERIIPLIEAEIEHREKLRALSLPSSPSPSFSESFPQQHTVHQE